MKYVEITSRKTFPGTGGANTPVIYVVDMPEHPFDIDEVATARTCTIVKVSEREWNDSLTPWRAPGLYRGNADFKGEADITLSELIGEAIPAIERMEALGAWIKANGDGVYATRPAAPYAKGRWRFTGSKDGKTLYAFRLWSEGERDLLAQTIPVEGPESVASVRHLATGSAVSFRATMDGLAIRLPETFRTNPCADGFAIEIMHR